MDEKAGGHVPRVDVAVRGLVGWMGDFNMYNLSQKLERTLFCDSNVFFQNEHGNISSTYLCSIEALGITGTFERFD